MASDGDEVGPGCGIECRLTAAEIDIESSGAALSEVERLWRILDSYDLHVHHTKKGPVICEHFAASKMCSPVLRLHRDADPEDYGEIPEIMLDMIGFVPALASKLRTIRGEHEEKIKLAASSAQNAIASFVRIANWCRDNGIKVPDEVIRGTPARNEHGEGK